MLKVSLISTIPLVVSISDCRKRQPTILQKAQQINISFTDYAIDYLAERGFDPQYGARPLKRIIQKDIINELSKKIIAGAIDKSKLLLIDVFDQIIVFRNDSK